MARVRLPLQQLKIADFPPVCAVCGRAADAVVRKRFSWRPKWLSAASVLSMLLFCAIAWPVLFILSESRRRRAIAELPMCQQHKRYWVWRGFWVLAPLLVIVVSSLTVGILVLARVIPFIGLEGVIASLLLIFAMWGVAALVAEHTGLRAIEITKEDLVLTGASSVFADLVRAGPRSWEIAEHREDGWEEYDPYPRNPPILKK